jgi:hypothetical protein
MSQYSSGSASDAEEPEPNSTPLQSQSNQVGDSLSANYHKIAYLLCPECLFLEFPGCSSHNQLLTCPREQAPHLSCRQCALEDRNHDSEYQVVATDTSTPWIKFCRSCQQAKAQVFNGLFQDEEAIRLANVLKTGKHLQGEEDDKESYLISCNQCYSVKFAIDSTQTELLTNFSFNSQREKAWHCSKYCTGETRLIKAKLSKSECEYLVACLPHTPYMRLPASELKLKIQAQHKAQHNKAFKATTDSIQLAQKAQNSHSSRSNDKSISDDTKKSSSVIEFPTVRAVHPGIVCDVCSMNPITGPRYQCSVVSSMAHKLP